MPSTSHVSEKRWFVGDQERNGLHSPYFGQTIGRSAAITSSESFAVVLCNKSVILEHITNVSIRIAYLRNENPKRMLKLLIQKR
jgi:hypothetical protein